MQVARLSKELFDQLAPSEFMQVIRDVLKQGIDRIEFCDPQSQRAALMLVESDLGWVDQPH